MSGLKGGTRPTPTESLISTSVRPSNSLRMTSSAALLADLTWRLPDIKSSRRGIGPKYHERKTSTRLAIELVLNLASNANVLALERRGISRLYEILDAVMRFDPRHP